MTSFQSLSPFRRLTILALALLALLISLDSMWQRKLANPDEGRYSVISREMANSGDFVTPRLNDIKYFYKPPLQYWASAFAMLSFGENEFSARLYTKLAGLGCILIMLFVGWRLYGHEVGLLTAMVMISSPYFSAMTEVVTLDMGLTFWMTLAMGAFLLGQHADSEMARRRWLCLAWAGMAGAVLSKGLIGIVFPAATIFFYGLANRDFRLWRELEWLRGLCIFFALTLPWFILVSQQNAEFPSFFFIHEHVDRFLTDEHRRSEPWHYFIPILLAGCLPWLVSLFPAVWQGITAPGHLTPTNARSFQPLKFILIFCIFIFLFFSKSQSKLPAYILIFFPVLALVIARYLHTTDSQQLSWQLLPTCFLALAGAYAASLTPARRARDAQSLMLYQDMIPWIVAAALLLAMGAAIAFVLLRRNHKWSAFIVVSFASLLSIAAIERGYEKLSPMQSGYALAAAIKPHLLDANSRVYAIKTYDQTLPFYLQRPILLVEYVDEFEMGQRREPEKTIASVANLPRHWHHVGTAVAIIKKDDLPLLQSLGLRFRIIHQSPRHVAIVKLAP